MPANFTGNHRPNLRLDGHCPLCNRSYDLHRLKVLGEHDQQVLAFIDCAHCGGAILSLLTISPVGLTAVGLLTDLQSHEVLDVRARQVVTGDDVLDLHALVDRDEASPINFVHP